MIKATLFFSIWIAIIANCEASNVVGFDKNLASHSILHGLVSMAMEGSKDTVCLQQMSTIAEGLANGSRWAVKIFDANGNPRTGLHWGNTFWLGNRKQCEATMTIKKLSLSPLTGPIVVETSNSISPFPVNYFGAYLVHLSDIQIKIHLENELRITLGLCLPSACKESEITEMLQKYFDSNTLYYQKIYNTTLTMEYTKKIVADTAWFNDGPSSALRYILLILLILCIVGTIYDIKIYRPLLKMRRKILTQDKQTDSNGNVNQNDNQNTMLPDGKNVEIDSDINLGYKLLSCFSAYRNNKFIFSTETKGDSIKCIHGIRFLCMVYIILGHTAYFLLHYYDNSVYPFYLKDTIAAQVFLNAHFNTDTFFCISGYLMTYYFFKTESHKNMNGIRRKTNIFLDYLMKRYFRIMPSYVVSILLTVAVTSWKTRSSIFWFNDRDDIVCEKYWWRNMLFINNFYPRDEMCQSWSWYLSCEMQFYIIISFLLILAVTHLKIAASILASIFISCIVYGAYATYVWEYIPILDRMHELRGIFYDPPWMRINPYIVGTVTGYMMYRVNNTIHLNKNTLRLLWSCSTLSILLMLFGFEDFNMSLSTSIVYVPMSRVLWSIYVAWILVACESGNGGIVNSILCFKLWMPLSRLTYWTYFLNPIVMYIYGSIGQRTLEADFHATTILGPSFILWAYLIAYVFVLLLEVPCANVCKTISKHVKDKKKSQKNLDFNKAVTEENKTK